MRGLRAAFMTAWLILLGGCDREVPRSQMPHLGNFCVHREKWGDLLVMMKGFAAARGLEFHGGAQSGPDGKPQFNAYIARGYFYYFGDDLDLWIVSNPFKEGDMAYNGISQKPWSPTDATTAHALLVATEPFRCDAPAKVR